MNYLGHFYLSPDNDEILIGSFLGDFVKGPVELQNLPTQIKQGIILHRSVDSFTDYHPLILDCKKLFSKTYRRYAGIILDMALDHFLALYWQEYHHQTLNDFSQHVYKVLSKYQQQLPGGSKQIAYSMCEYDWLGSYANLENIDLAFSNIAKRFRHKNPLLDAGSEFIRLYDSIELMFRKFIIEVSEHTNNNIR